ncbi:hypothetical protein BGX29_001906 [Mortierella sp. GBA35]|nr:hypothetical protein BGX29_001906 [Mortierella sp. GBA35]
MASTPHTHTAASVHPDDDDDDQSPQPIISPALVTLRMHGPWGFTDLSVLSHFLTKTFPNLRSLSAIKWDLLFISDVLRVVTARPEPTTMKELFLDLDWDLGVEGENEFRLYHDDGDDLDFDRKDVVTEVKLWAQVEPYVILREGAPVSQKRMS